MTPLADERLESKSNQDNCHIYKEKFKEEDAVNGKYCKVRDHCYYIGKYRGDRYSICNLRYSITEEVPVIFHNGSNNDYCFVIKQLGEEFDCLGKNKEKYITFSVRIKKNKLKELVKEEKKLNRKSYLAS